MKSENGGHRLVRVSPFDANARRQTSFAAVEVIPEITDDSKDVDIRPEDIEMQVFRSSGAGGQHINKTSSAVRLIHKPTGIVVSCQTQRDQFQNRETCMRMLRSKLIEIKEREHLDKISDIKGAQLKIEWGSQIRNYVFMPYTLAKDTRRAGRLYQCLSHLRGDQYMADKILTLLRFSAKNAKNANCHLHHAESYGIIISAVSEQSAIFRLAVCR